MRKVAVSFVSLLLLSCTMKKEEPVSFVEENIAFARAQIGREIAFIESSGKVLNPVTVKPEGGVYYCDYTDWRSSFSGLGMVPV